MGLLRSNPTPVGIKAAAGAPAWFTAVAEKTWTPIPGTSAANINSLTPSPVPGTGVAGYNGPAVGIIRAWVGGCVDQSRKELILAANGGHNDYPGNEVYALKVDAASPKWVRITDPTPNDSLLKDAEFQSGGIPSAMHTYNTPVFVNGKVWFGVMSAWGITNPSSSFRVCTFDRSLAGAGPFLGEGGAAIPYTNVQSMGLWQDGGSSNPGNLPGFPSGSPCVYERINGKIWVLPNASADFVSLIDPSSGTVQQFNRGIGNPVFGSQPAVAAYDTNVPIVIGVNQSTQGGNTIYVWNANNPGGGARQITGMPDGLHAGFGGVYHAPSKAFLFMHQADSTSQIKKLKINNPSDAFNSSFTWSTINAAGGAVQSDVGTVGSYGRFNIIEDMGNGQSALVYIGGITLPAYIYKLPMTELF